MPIHARSAVRVENAHSAAQAHKPIATNMPVSTACPRAIGNATARNIEHVAASA